MSILYLFIDGIGFGEKSEINPFHLYSKSLFQHLCKTIPQDSVSKEFHVHPVDAHMGIEGLPQSATGQTSLWTGINGPQVMGRHFTGFPGPTLREVIYEHSIVKKFTQSGLKSTLLNGYSDQYLERIENKPRLMSTSTHIQKASGQDLLSTDDVRAGKAMYMDITHEMFHQLFPDRTEDLPVLDARERGHDCIKMTRNYDLTIFEYFLTDKAGHNQSYDEALFTIKTLERFIQGLVEEMNPQEETILITSDHGNLEDLSVKTHTNNKVPLYTAGKLKDEFKSGTEFLCDIPHRIYEIYSIQS